MRVTDKSNAKYLERIERLRRRGDDDSMRVLISFAWADLSTFRAPAAAVDELLPSSDWATPEEAARREGKTISIPQVWRVPRGMAALRELQAQLRQDLELLVKDLPKALPKARWTRLVPYSLCQRIDERIPALRFVVDRLGERGPAFLPRSGEPLERILYFLLGEMLSRGILNRLARCDYCKQPFVRKLAREERSGRTFCSDNCRTTLHNKSKTREERTEERRITRGKQRTTIRRALTSPARSL